MCLLCVCPSDPRWVCYGRWDPYEWHLLLDCFICEIANNFEEPDGHVLNLSFLCVCVCVCVLFFFFLSETTYTIAALDSDHFYVQQFTANLQLYGSMGVSKPITLPPNTSLYSAEVNVVYARHHRLGNWLWEKCLKEEGGGQRRERKWITFFLFYGIVKFLIVRPLWYCALCGTFSLIVLFAGLQCEQSSCMCKRRRRGGPNMYMCTPSSSDYLGLVMTLHIICSNVGSGSRVAQVTWRIPAKLGTFPEEISQKFKREQKKDNNRVLVCMYNIPYSIPGILRAEPWMVMQTER